MNAKDLIQLLRSAVEKIKSEGGTVVSVIGLESFLSDVEKELESDSLPAEAIEHAKLVHESNLAAYAAQTASSRELFKSVIETAKMTVTSLILINGGSRRAHLPDDRGEEFLAGKCRTGSSK